MANSRWFWAPFLARCESPELGRLSKGLNELASKVTPKVNNNSISLVDPLPATVNALPQRISLVDDEPQADQSQTILGHAILTLYDGIGILAEVNTELGYRLWKTRDAVKNARSESELNTLFWQVETAATFSDRTEEWRHGWTTRIIIAPVLITTGKTSENCSMTTIGCAAKLKSYKTSSRARLITEQLQEATRSLKDVIYKQGALKHSIAESKHPSRIWWQPSSTDLMWWHIRQKTINTRSMIFSANHAHKRCQWTRKILHSIIDETQTVQSEASRSQAIMLAAQKEVKRSGNPALKSSRKTTQMEELVREDQLTGSLNRRGLDDNLRTWADRADRRGTPMCAQC